MKQYEFDLNEHILKKFFIPIRTKANTIEVLMEALKYMLINPSIDEEKIRGKLILKIDKMSRLFFFTDDKYFSLTFPFFVNKIDDDFLFFSNLVSSIDNKLISQVLEIISCDEFKTNCSIDFIAPICEVEENCNEYFWAFLRELLLMEEGYIRYDFDTKNYLEYKCRNEEHKHPENHYDFFYSSNATLKVGLYEKIDPIDLIDFLDTGTDCKYLTNP